MTSILSIQLITISFVILNRETLHQKTVQQNHWKDSYDYVVVGAGAAGCAVAHRLSEDRETTVLLLEAGDRQSIITDIPGTGMIGNSYIGHQYDWNYTAVMQKSIGLGYVNSTFTFRKGRILGGTSSVNGVAYNRGNRRDFDDWVTTYGANGWTYEEVLPFFIKSENNYDLSLVRKNPGYHGTNGLVGVKSYEDPDPIFLLMRKKFNEMSYPTVDLNGAHQLGTAIGQSFISGYGLRSTAANSFIDPNPYPKNLKVLINSLVTRVIFEGMIAKGVEFIRNNKVYKVSAKREVILSAGMASID